MNLFEGYQKRAFWDPIFRLKAGMESGMDFDREGSEALEYQARTTALLMAVVAKDKKEREATKRKAAEEKRKEAAAKRQAGAPRQRGRQGSS